MTVRIPVGVIVFVLALSGCGGKAPPAAPPPPVVTVIRPGSAEVQDYYEYNGTLEPVEMVMIPARVEGVLTGVLFPEGKEVPANTLLYTIDPREYKAAVSKSKADIAKAKADMKNAEAQIALAESELRRLRKIGVDAASPSEIEKAEAQVAANKAQFDVAKANKEAGESSLEGAELKLSYTEIRAPIAGLTSRTRVTVGNIVGQKDATLLTTIVSVEPMFANFDIPERDLPFYREVLAQSLRSDAGGKPYRVEVGLTNEEGYPHVGILDMKDNRVESGTGTVRIRGRIPNPQIELPGTVEWRQNRVSIRGHLLVPRVGPIRIRKLYAGLYIRVRVPTGPAKKQLVIPEDALMTGQEGRYVYILGANNTVEKRTVTVGPTVWRASAAATGRWTMTNPHPPEPNADSKIPPAPTTAPVRSVVAIEGGLQPGDTIVAVGLQKVFPGRPVTPEVWDFNSPPTK